MPDTKSIRLNALCLVDTAKKLEPTRKDTAELVPSLSSATEHMGKWMRCALTKRKTSEIMRL